MPESLVKIEHLTIQREGIESISDLSLEVFKGDDMVLFGPERSGLSTLVLVILGIENQYEGDVYYKGKRIKDFDYIALHDHKRSIGYLHGDYGLLSNMSVEENLSLPLEYYSELSRGEIRELVSALINEFGLLHCKNERPIRLTSSEIFRTAYARAIIDDPDLLIIDHSIVEHSLVNIRSFFDNLEKRMGNPEKVTMFFTYQPKIFVDFASRFTMLYKGSVVYDGERNSFYESGNPYVTQFLEGLQSGPMEIL